MRKQFVGWFRLVCLSVILLTACGDDSPELPPLAVTLYAQDIKFTPTTINVKVNQRVKLTYTNEGVIDHSLTIPGFVQVQKIRPGQTLEFTFTPEEAGQFTYICQLPGHELAGMVGTLLVAP